MAENFAQGLLGNPFFNIGAGLLSVAGPSLQPRSIGEGLLAGVNQAQRAQAMQTRNELIRGEMADRARRREAQERLRELIKNGGVISENPEADAEQARKGDVSEQMGAAQRQGEMMGLLAQANPEQFTQAMTQQLFGQDRAAPADIRTMQALNIPLTPEGFKQFQEMKGDGGMDALKSNQMLLQNRLDMLRAEQLEREGKAEAAEKQRNKIAARQSVNNSVSRLDELITLNERLRDTIGESGIGFAEARGMGAGLFPALVKAFGGDEAKARQTAADFQRFEQLTTSEALNAMANADGLGQGTNQKLNTILQTKPGPARLPSVNNKIFADMLQTVLDDAEKQDIEIENRDQLREMITGLRAGMTPIRARSMPFSELRSFVERSSDRELNKLPESVRNVIEQRLKGGR